MTRRPRLPAPPTSLMLAIILPALLVWGTLFALLVHPAYAQEGSGPAKPTGLTATATHDQVVLTWDDPQDDSITGYVILRRVRVNDVGGEFSELAPDTGTAATTYTDDSVAADTTYTYRIKAINEHGESERSRWFHVATLELPVPSKPTGLTAEASHDRVVLAWDDPQDDSITRYRVLRRDWDPTSSFAVIEEDRAARMRPTRMRRWRRSGATSTGCGRSTPMVRRKDRIRRGRAPRRRR